MYHFPCIRLCSEQNIVYISCACFIIQLYSPMLAPFFPLTKFTNDGLGYENVNKALRKKIPYSCTFTMLACKQLRFSLN